MATPTVRTIGSTSGTVTGTGRDDLVIGETVTALDVNPSNSGASYQWSFIDIPPGSATTISTPTSPSCSFIPDVTGTYALKCLVNGAASAIKLLGVPLANTGARMPAFKEEDLDNGFGAYDGDGNTKGWHPALIEFMRETDDLLGGSSPPTGSAGGDLGGTYPNPEVAAIHETSGPTKLTIGAVANTQMLVRSGGTLVGQAVPTSGTPTGAAGGDLASTYPNPEVAAVHETSGPTKLTIGAIADGEFVKRVGSTLVSDAVSGTPTGSAGGDLAGTYPNPEVAAIHETSGPTKLTVGNVVDGEFLKRVGSTLVSSVVSTADEKAKVSAADTTSDYLFSKLVAGSAIGLTILNPGANETLRIAATASNFGVSGEKVTSVLRCAVAESHNSDTPKVTCQFALNPPDYVLTNTTRTLTFRAVATNGNSGLTTHVELYSVTDAESISILDFTTTSPAIQEEVLTIGAGAGEVDDSQKIYEVRIWVDSPLSVIDTIELGSAELQFTNLIT